ncbi:histidinol-phosphate transaminase [Mobilicoccus pelagius]|uniref:Aromatic amino acid aminotransferase n=1 Tax=Mobilicoccus pelagius NBRC 104925 TaxID=1089455 RepID=H5UW22_9MICO|nr:histidinol-phosphate transaminase [Mobilicoccus pelagius]GAB49930.1 histidinol-phosphate aminotransferase [Mobilicoccus pelagius NBRC 104925]
MTDDHARGVAAGEPQDVEGAEAVVHLREALYGVPVYKPGKPPTVVPDVVPYKMSSNENPFPPLPGVVEAVSEAARAMNRYPDMGGAELRTAIAADLGVSPEEIVPGTGSSGVLSAIVGASCEAGDEVVYAWRSFEAYPIMVALSGARSVQVPVTEDGRHDLAAMSAAITPDTRLVLVCSPNNPTGPAVGAAELEEFLSTVPEGVLVVLDEAYLEFVRDEAAVDGLAVYRAHPNVVLLRTFSKAYGLAGLRVGYAVARPRLATALRSCVIPFAVSDLAARAAIASLGAKKELFERVEHLVEERGRMLAALRDLGYDVPDTQSNFLWLPLEELAEGFAEAADARGLSVRPFAGEGVRVSVEVPEANDRLLEVARDFRGQAS